MTKPKILLFDIESTYSEGAFWGGRKYDQNILKVTRERELLSVAWKWVGGKVINIDTRAGEKTDKRLTTVLKDLLEQADMVVAHNGDKFDITVGRTRMLHHRMPPLKQQVSVDTCKVAKKYFSFTGNSLEDLAQFLGVGSKLPTQGLSLWTGCMNNDKDSWDVMSRYNKHDVFLLEGVYDILRPWIENHPNVSRIIDPKALDSCPSCQSVSIRKYGLRATLTTVRQRWLCNDCGKNWVSAYFGGGK